ncbi:MAG TPA: thioesterase family protein [Acidimicrobiales bacterium]|nr:thioesterase family protein [Acidimicrobiales bacterium]
MTVTNHSYNRSFSEVSALTTREPGLFEAVVDPQWTIGGKPNGGYLLAMLGSAAVLASNHDHVIAASAHYLHAPEPGPVIIDTDALRAGRSASQVRARLEQQGQTCVEALVTVAHLSEGTTPYWDRGLPRMSTVGFEESVRLLPVLPNGKRVAIMEQVDLRLEPQARGFTVGQPTGRGELRGWLALPCSETFDPSSLLFALDAFPPATFDVEFSGWVPTLELTCYIRALPRPGPVRVLQRAQLIDAGRVDEACFIWDSAGRLVAQGTQLAGIRLG